ncbi:MAG: hypothetical protein CO108_29900 [Deltaproteobacteria bacterium CG_4_9_14_3_um_filter_63_12]|nr:MAG: hypothetical protein CO108_29900 [Deltaproteobacteria bacterium CG_4_9_14_3_um_filter_63_12]
MRGSKLQTVANPTETQPICDENEPSIPLEGDGWVVVRMPAEIELGDHIGVVEVSGCASGLGGRTPEPFRVSIESESEVHPLVLGTGVGPYARFEVVARPIR